MQDIHRHAGEEINLIHCSYHKCLTMYFHKVMNILYNVLLPWSRGYHHFKSNVDDFYAAVGECKLISLNNHKLDLSRLGNFRVSRFIRDPRDLVISGYFYHKRGAEDWCNIVGPSDEDWKIVNGNIPKGMGKNHSFSSYLQNLSEEDGLIAEIEFRRWHFKSMLEWSRHQDSRIMTFRYEDILNKEASSFRELFRHYEASLLERNIGIFLAKMNSAKVKNKISRHIRNPRPKQWQQYFTPKLKEYFSERYEELLKKLGYPLE